ncbi:PKD domain-containing protein [Flexibacterium corallicola]|uniref:PKD domain-containing protein n=1 Tax=Flexibacterium corallicola TaxID=3037259 RepID=UPI00286ED707|nr:PKD domain-containing protein [Pseudovibrio sp. M1P-2-3]
MKLLGSTRAFIARLGLGTGACLLLSSVAMADPTAALTASRLSGPAPLAVFFDATDTTDSDASIDPFRQLGYYFDFDDPNSGTWQYSGKSKNIETGGPLAAHVFDEAGTYEVGLRAQNPNGSTSDAWVTITVEDPDITYAGTNTIVLSTGSDFTDAPAGAQQLANVTSWPNFQSNKRYLLKAGDDFTALGQLRVNRRSNFQIGSFGDGTKPKVERVMLAMHVNDAANPAENGVIQDLATESILQHNMFNDLLVYENELISNSAYISFAGAVSWFADPTRRGNSSAEDWKHPGHIYLVENHLSSLGNPEQENRIAGLAHHVAVLGNYSGLVREHSVRLFGTYKSVVSHNKLTGPAILDSKHDLKVHANGLDEWPADHSLFVAGTNERILPATRYVRINDNVFGRPDSPIDWHVQVAPQDDGSSGTVEGLRDVIVENNEYIDGNGNVGLERSLQTLGHNITERGNAIPTAWSDPITAKTYPSNYSDYSPLYTLFWHGPYFIDDVVPATSAPQRTTP